MIFDVSRAGQVKAALSAMTALCIFGYSTLLFAQTANEEAVLPFHAGRIGFLDIVDTVQRVVDAHQAPLAQSMRRNGASSGTMASSSASVTLIRASAAILATVAVSTDMKATLVRRDQGTGTPGGGPGSSRVGPRRGVPRGPARARAGPAAWDGARRRAPAPRSPWRGRRPSAARSCRGSPPRPSR